jgi:hypothetical protein
VQVIDDQQQRAVRGGLADPRGYGVEQQEPGQFGIGLAGSRAPRATHA